MEHWHLMGLEPGIQALPASALAKVLLGAHYLPHEMMLFVATVAQVHPEWRATVLGSPLYGLSAGCSQARRRLLPPIARTLSHAFDTGILDWTSARSVLVSGVVPADQRRTPTGVQGVRILASVVSASSPLPLTDVRLSSTGLDADSFAQLAAAFAFNTPPQLPPVSTTLDDDVTKKKAAIAKVARAVQLDSLFIACGLDHTEIAASLVHDGMDPNAVVCFGTSPVSLRTSRFDGDDDATTVWMEFLGAFNFKWLTLNGELTTRCSPRDLAKHRQYYDTVAAVDRACEDVRARRRWRVLALSNNKWLGDEGALTGLVPLLEGPASELEELRIDNIGCGTAGIAAVASRLPRTLTGLYCHDNEGVAQPEVASESQPGVAALIQVLPKLALLSYLTPRSLVKYAPTKPSTRPSYQPSVPSYMPSMEVDYVPSSFDGDDGVLYRPTSPTYVPWSVGERALRN